MTTPNTTTHKVQAGSHTLLLEHDVDIPMRDGACLKANVFRAPDGAPQPVIVTLGPYGKDLHFSGHRKDIWDRLLADNPDILQASSGRWMVFETPDPEVWVPHGYVVVRIDSRGACKSPGMLDVNSPQEFDDFHDAIEWAGVQPWSNGRVGLLGVSYYACGQWMAAARRPRHLAAIQPWQGTADFFRGRTRTGGIFCNGFVGYWWDRLLRNQHGNPACELRDMLTGERLSGSVDVGDAELAANRRDYIAGVLAHPLCDAFYAERSADLARIDVPALVVANWGGLGLHLAGTVAGWVGLPDDSRKWLKVQTGSYFATFYRPQSVALQRRFFDRWLKGAANGWRDDEPRVEVEQRSADDGVDRTLAGGTWPLPQTVPLRLHLDAAGFASPDAATAAGVDVCGVSGASSQTQPAATAAEPRAGGGLLDAAPAAAAAIDYDALSAGIAFRTAPLADALDLAGPFAARLAVSSDRPDMDLFVTLQAFAPDGREITFRTDNEPKQPLTQGWLRVAQRRLDAARSTAWTSVHSHVAHEPLVPGQPGQIDVELWPASVCLPAGSVLQLLLQGQDFARAGVAGPMRGSGLFTHTHPLDRPPERYGGRHTIHTGAERACWLQLPVLGRETVPPGAR